MEQKNRKEGLVLVIDWPHKTQFNYKGFDGKAVWPDAQLKPDGYSFLQKNGFDIYDTFIKLNNEKLDIRNGVVDICYLDQVLNYKKTLSNKSRILYLRFSNFSNTLPKLILDKFTFSGYDYGNYIWEENYYSVILHEIILGSRTEFKKFSKYLNQNLLLQSLNIVLNIEKTYHELIVKGEHLETYEKGEEFQPIAVYSYYEN